MAQQLWNGEGVFGTPTKTYKTYATAQKKALEIIGDAPVRFLIAATHDGRFFGVALGQAACDYGLHHRMCVTN